MAVVPKKRKNSTSYYVCTWFSGKAYWERSGTDKREAERLDARRKREVEAGEFRPHEVVRSSSVADYAKQWGGSRSNPSANDDRRNLARFSALPDFSALHLDDVRPRHVISAIETLRKGTVREKTIRNAYGTLRTMFRDAVIAELVASSPCTLPKDFWNFEDSEEREAYERSEAAVLVRHDAIPWPIRILNALCLLGGLREGEACGRRWRDLDQEAAPLWCLDVRSQYGGRILKTKRPRIVPVHPELAALLEEWGRAGFVDLMGQPPTPDDFIVPRVSRRDVKGHHTRSTYYKAFVAGCSGAGVRARSLHSTRHTMITLARRGGADKDDLRTVTHNPKGDIIDRYTHKDWEPLCDAVLCIGSLFGARPSPRRIHGYSSDSGTSETGKGVPMLADSSSDGKSSLVQLPAPPPINRPETEKRQSSSQSDSVGNGAYPRSPNQLRLERLRLIAAVEPDSVAPGLAVCEGLDLVRSGDLFGAIAVLKAEAERAHG